MDANLVGLARKWLDKMMPYRRMAKSFVSFPESCLPGVMFLRFLLARDCTIIGISADRKHAYLRCGDKLVRFDIQFIVHNCYEKIEDVVGKVPIMHIDNERELMDKRPYGGINFSGVEIYVDVFGNEPIYLGTLGDTPLYLRAVEVNSWYLGGIFDYTLGIRLGTEFIPNGSGEDVHVVYGLEGGKIGHAHLYNIDRLLEKAPVEDLEQFERILLAMLNEKYVIMDNLLKEVADIFIEGFRAIIVALLY